MRDAYRGIIILLRTFLHKASEEAVERLISGYSVAVAVGSNLRGIARACIQKKIECTQWCGSRHVVVSEAAAASKYKESAHLVTQVLHATWPRAVRTRLLHAQRPVFLVGPT
eukprot:6172456-Pleurochrysis_carterae.AAC.1